MRRHGVLLLLLAMLVPRPATAQVPVPVAGGLTQPAGVHQFGPDLGANGGFETNDGTKPTGWLSDAAWTVDPASPRTGGWSFRLSDAPAVPFIQVARQNIVLRKGIYRLSGWIRTEALGANDPQSGVRLNLDYGAGDTALRGLTPVVNGTREWTYFERPNIVVPSDRTAVLKLEAFREPSGRAWFDDVRVEEQLPTPLDVLVLHPSYRGMLFEDESQTMRFDVAVHPPGGDFAAHRVRGTLREEQSGAIVATGTWPAAPSLVATFEGGVMEPGRAYLAAFSLVDAGSSAVLYTYPAYRVSRVSAETRAGMAISFDEQGRVLIHGTPRFVLGVYDSGSGYGTTDAFWENQLWSPTGERRMDGLRINFYLNYWYGHAPASAMTSLMTNLERHGVMYLQTGNCFQQSPASAGNFQIDASDDYVRTIGAHPASAGYYTIDECDSVLVPGAHQQYRRLAGLDPDSKTFGALLANPPAVFFWSDTADVLATDPYPLVGAEPTGGYRHSLVADWTVVTRQAVLDARPFMTVLQFFKFTSLGRFPTPSEMRSHAYMAIVEGARGLWWWSLGANGLRDVCSGWCDEKTQHMNSLKSLVSELADLEPVLLADDTPGALTATSHPAQIRTKVKTVDGTRYLLAYNYTGGSITATFTWASAPTRVTVYEEGRELAVSGASFTDTFGPYAAHVYILEAQPELEVRLLTPGDGATLSGTVTVAAEATGGDAQTYTFAVDGATIASGPGSTTTWDTRTVANGPHVVGVAVTDTAGRTASASAKVTVDNPVVVPPAAPSALTARTLGGRRIALSWRDNSTTETGFIVERSTGGSAFTEVARLGVNASGYTDSGLVRNRTYSYRVRAFNPAGVSSPSNTVTAQAK